MLHQITAVTNLITSYKIRLRYFTTTIPLQSFSRAHLGNFLHRRFTTIFATSGFVLSAAPRSTPSCPLVQGLCLIPDNQHQPSCLHTKYTVPHTITSQDAFRKEGEKKKMAPPLSKSRKQQHLDSMQLILITSGKESPEIWHITYS